LKKLPEAGSFRDPIDLDLSRICFRDENLEEMGAFRSKRMQGDSPGGTDGGFRTRLVAVVAVVAALLAWLWPIGIGGRMPAGGDVTQFFLGLMGFLGEALRDGELPVWNDLWGYGFPGLAESQIGACYPPHVVLYGRMFTEAAYVASLVLHTLWGGLGAFWASRRMGVSGVGAALSAFAWSSSGFFLIHLAHPWGYTTGCWMPWAWGLGWSILAPGGRTSRAAPFLLSVVLVLQVLPGHFQLAFQTQVTLALMVLWATLGRWAADLRRRRREPAAPIEGPGPSLRRAVAVTLAVAAVFPLAAIQLRPTARLAELAGGQRDFEYLSGFAETPVHLANLVAPGLFHRSTAWRPILWDPLHTSPEECLVYIGLVPLFLAVLAMVKEFRRDAAVRLLTILALVTLYLSLGPYVPGFRVLIELPGFSFFRAPSRWSLATSLALAILAGKAFDRWREWPRPGRWIRCLVVVAALWIAAALGLVELAVRGTAETGWPRVAGWFDRAFKAMPWYGEPTLLKPDPTFREVMARARRPADEPHLPAELPPSVVLQKSVNPRSVVGQRGMIYVRELWETAVWLILIGIAAGTDRPGDRRTRAAPALLLLLTFLDLWTLGRHRLIDTEPIRPLAEQSPVLARLAQERRGARIASNLGNLPILEGLAPIVAYRTLNLPALESLTKLAQDPLIGPYEPMVRAALRATGTRLRIFHPVEIRLAKLRARTELPGEPIDDPALARWLYGASWASEQGDWVNRFLVWRVDELPAKAWFLPLTDGDEESILDGWTGDPDSLLPLFDRADPLPVESSRPEDRTVLVQADEPGWVIVSQLDDPQWSARWIGLDNQGEFREEIRPAFRKPGDIAGGWQAIQVPFHGRWRLRLTYQPRDVVEGAGISLIAWIGWAFCALVAALRRRGGTGRRNHE
jgi:hypothetical protein